MQFYPLFADPGGGEWRGGGGRRRLRWGRRIRRWRIRRWWLRRWRIRRRLWRWHVRWWLWRRNVRWWLRRRNGLHGRGGSECADNRGGGRSGSGRRRRGNADVLPGSDGLLSGVRRAVHWAGVEGAAGDSEPHGQYPPDPGYSPGLPGDLETPPGAGRGAQAGVGGGEDLRGQPAGRVCQRRTGVFAEPERGDALRMGRQRAAGYLQRHEYDIDGGDAGGKQPAVTGGADAPRTASGRKAGPGARAVRHREHRRADERGRHGPDPEFASRGRHHRRREL